MKNTMILLGCLGIGYAHAQQIGRDHPQHQSVDARVGINTSNPVATLDISKVSDIPNSQVQGFLLPHLSQDERNAMSQEFLVNGLMIFNTNKNCIDWWDGAHWQCKDGTYQDQHGDAPGEKYHATFSFTATADFTRNNCPAGQQGTKVSYTTNSPIISRATSDISQEVAKKKAEQLATIDFKTQGQQYANERGTCQAQNPIIEKCPHFESHTAYTGKGYRLAGLKNWVPEDITNLNDIGAYSRIAYYKVLEEDVEIAPKQFVWEVSWTEPSLFTTATDLTWVSEALRYGTAWGGGVTQSIDNENNSGGSGDFSFDPAGRTRKKIDVIECMINVN